MSAKLYYTPPSDEAFEDMRKACIELWNTYDNSGGYVDEKTERIKVIHNVGDNFMYMFAMLDINNQRKVAAMLAPETKEAVRERMIDGGNPTYLIEEILGV